MAAERSYDSPPGMLKLFARAVRGPGASIGRTVSLRPLVLLTPSVAAAVELPRRLVASLEAYRVEN